MLSPRGATDLCGARCVPELPGTGWAVSGQAPDQGAGRRRQLAARASQEGRRRCRLPPLRTLQEAGLSVQGRGLEHRAARSLG